MDDLASGLRRYFRKKATELDSLADQVIAEHSSLRGSHRENINKNYLEAILPARFRVGSGMVYDSYGNRSLEADIVLWDANNYPSLPSLGHSTFFAESVRAILEVKSTWNSDEWTDIKEKCRRIANLRVIPEPTVIDHITYMKEVIKSIYTGHPVPLFSLEAPKIGTAAIIFKGGEKFKAQDITQEEIEEIDRDWPDVLLFLSAGKVVRKSARDLSKSPKNIRPYEGKYPSFTNRSWLEFLDIKEDALLVFTSTFLALLRNRSIQTEAPFYLERYVNQMLYSQIGYSRPEYIIEFPVPLSYPGRPWNPT